MRVGVGVRVRVRVSRRAAPQPSSPYTPPSHAYPPPPHPPTHPPRRRPTSGSRARSRQAPSSTEPEQRREQQRGAQPPLRLARRGSPSSWSRRRCGARTPHPAGQVLLSTPGDPRLQVPRSPKSALRRRSSERAGAAWAASGGSSPPGGKTSLSGSPALRVLSAAAAGRVSQENALHAIQCASSLQKLGSRDATERRRREMVLGCCFPSRPSPPPRNVAPALRRPLAARLQAATLRRARLPRRARTDAGAGVAPRPAPEARRGGVALLPVRGPSPPPHATSLT